MMRRIIGAAVLGAFVWLFSALLSTYEHTGNASVTVGIQERVPQDAKKRTVKHTRALCRKRYLESEGAPKLVCLAERDVMLILLLALGEAKQTL